MISGPARPETATPTGPAASQEKPPSPSEVPVMTPQRTAVAVPTPTPSASTVSGSPASSPGGEQTLRYVNNGVPKPDPKALRISEAAADDRLRRTMTPSLRDGSYKVSDEVLKQYRKGGKGKKSLMKIFETCGYCKDHTLPQVHALAMSLILLF